MCHAAGNGSFHCSLVMRMVSHQTSAATPVTTQLCHLLIAGGSLAPRNRRNCCGSVISQKWWSGKGRVYLATPPILSKDGFYYHLFALESRVKGKIPCSTPA